MSNTMKENKMGTMPVNKLLINMALPMMISMLVQALYNIVDSIFVARISEEALTAVSMAFPMQNLMIGVAGGVGVGTNALLSRALGEGRHEEADKMAVQGIFITACSYIIFLVIGLFFAREFFVIQGANEVIADYGYDYLSVILIISFGCLFQMIFERLLQATGRTFYSMITQGTGAIINIILDPILIFVFNMGVAGAAIATVISQIASAIWTVGFLLSKKATYTIKLRHMIRLNSRRIKKILSLGLAGFTMLATNAAVQMVCNMTLKQYGSDLYIGIMTIITSVRDILVLPVQGFSQGAQPVLGYNYGAEKNGRVKKAIKYMSVILISYTVLAWMTVAVFPQFFIRIFTENADLLAGGVPALHIYFFGFFFMALQFCAQTVFTALDKPKQAVFFSMFRKIIIVVPMTVLLPIFWTPHVNGVFWAEPISNLIGGAAAFTTMILTVYKKL